MGTATLLAWSIVQILVGFHLVFPAIIYVLYLLKGNTTVPALSHNVTTPDYGIIVTAYEQIDSIPAVVQSLLKLEHNHFLIYVVADKCDISNLHFADERVILLRPPEVLASNTRSHFYAIRHFKRPHSHLTIIDSDNLVPANYLKELDVFFQKGYVAVQGERKAKNLNTHYACLDAARDIYYHFFDGKVLFHIGSSATLAGSGMAFTTALYRECLEQLDVQGAGFDKVLQKEIVNRKHRIAFTEKAIVYDEKTSRTDQLVKQRARWINTWFRYFGFGFPLAGKGIWRLNWNQFIFGLVLLRPPLFLLLIAGMVCIVVNVLLGNFLDIYIWLAGYLLFVLTFLIALWSSPTDKRIYYSLWRIPIFIFYQVLSLLKVRKANKHSVATRHYVSEEEIT